MAISENAFILPQYKWDLSHSAKAQNFQREMADRKYNAEALNEEAKNWSGAGIDKLDPIYRKPVLDALSEYSMAATEYLKKNPNGKGLTNDPVYLEKKRKFQDIYLGQAKPGTDALKARDAFKMTHPDAMIPVDDAIEKAIQDRDPDALMKAQGSLIITPHTNLKINFDQNKLNDEVIKFATAKEPTVDRVVKNGKIYEVTTPNISDEAAAHFVANAITTHPYMADVPNATEKALQAVSNAKRPSWKEVKPDKEGGSINLNMGMGGGANGKWAWNRDENAAPITTSTVKVVANSKVIEEAKGKSIESMQKRFAGIATPEEVAYLKEYADASLENRIKLAEVKGIPTLSTKKYDVELNSDIRYNLQNIAATENKMHSWKTYNGAARDTKTGLPIKGTVVDGELLDVIHTPGNKKFPEGWYTLIADANNKVVAIPYEKSATEIKTYTVDKYGKNGFDLTEVISKGGTAVPVQKASTADPSEWNKKWSALKPGETLVGLDGKTYTKK